MLKQNYLNLLARYQSIMPVPELLQQVLVQPLPQCFWVNELKITVANFQGLLEDEGVICDNLAWSSSGFKCDPLIKLGKSWLYLTGLLQIQEEVSMLPVHILKPQPGERVLDLCAAPGNKTAQMAIRMQNQGLIVANDCRYARMKAMGQIMRRLGLLNVNVTINDGRHLPCADNVFDKILVDAPCSCEGTLRKNMHKQVSINLANSCRMAQLQTSLLKKAVTLLRPGGSLVYSTCTFAPEENEAVVDAVLTTYKDQLELVPIEIANFNYCPGLTTWAGDKFSDQLKHAMRVWPHQNNSGGFFVAHFRKKGKSAGSSSSMNNKKQR